MSYEKRHLLSSYFSFSREYYYRSVVWKDSYQVAVTWWNRPQNVSVTTICQVDTGICDLNYEQETPNGWIVQVRGQS